MPSITAETAVIKVPENTKSVALAVKGDGGTMDVTYRITEDADAIDIPWSVGQVADGSIDSTVIEAPVTSIRVTGTGDYNVSCRG